MSRGSIGNPLQTEASDADIKAAAQGGPKKDHFRAAQKVFGKLAAFKDRTARKFHAAHPAVTRGRDAAGKTPFHGTRLDFVAKGDKRFINKARRFPIIFFGTEIANGFLFIKGNLYLCHLGLLTI